MIPAHSSLLYGKVRNVESPFGTQVSMPLIIVADGLNYFFFFQAMGFLAGMFKVHLPLLSIHQILLKADLLYDCPYKNLSGYSIVTLQDLSIALWVVPGIDK